MEFYKVFRGQTTETSNQNMTSKTIQYHASLPNFSRIVYGAWRLNDTPTTPKQVLDKIHACIDQGITTFDHADIYGNYACETLFGQAMAIDKRLKKITQHVSKCDIMLKSDVFPRRRVKHYDTSAAHIKASVETSLQRLNIDALDIVLLHRPDPFMNHLETGAALDDLIKSGKIRAAGVSNFKPWDFSLLQGGMKNPLVTNQIEISLLKQESFSNGDIALMQQLGRVPMAWSPLAGGALFGDSEAARRLRPALIRLGAEFGVQADAVAIAWLLAHPANIAPIYGTNNLARIKRMSDAYKVKLDRETWFELMELASGKEVA
jgi:predicted oxidoreductase